MAYMNKTTFEAKGALLSYDKSEDYFEIDELMVPAIRELNLKGYYTTNCCSGHIFEFMGEPYVAFEWDGIRPETKPEGWQYSDDGSGEAIYYILDIEDEFERAAEILKQMKILYLWAKSLPDAKKLSEIHRDQL